MKNFCRAIFPVLAAFLFVTFNQSASAAEARSPSVTVTQFYKWYLHEMNADHDPLTDGRTKLRGYVTNALITEVLHGAGQGADYFTKSQDYFPDWETNLSVKESAIDQANATEVLTMGNTKESTKTFTITLVKEGSAWKIRKVAGDLEPPGAATK